MRGARIPKLAGGVQLRRALRSQACEQVAAGVLEHVTKECIYGNTRGRFWASGMNLLPDFIGHSLRARRGDVEVR